MSPKPIAILQHTRKVVVLYERKKDGSMWLALSGSDLGRNDRATKEMAQGGGLERKGQCAE
jgi:hypothetical protein